MKSAVLSAVGTAVVSEVTNSKLFGKVTQALSNSGDVKQLVKALNALTVPKDGKTYVDIDGNKITLGPKDRLNLVVDTKASSAVRVIQGKVVFEQGEDRTLPAGLKKADLQRAFKKESQGNIFIDSAASVSKSNGVIAIRSENCFFDETSHRSLAIDSSFTRCIDAMDNKVIQSPNTAIFLSHNNLVEDSAGADSSKVDHKKADKAYMTLSSGEELRGIATADPRTLIINIDGAKIVRSPGAQVVSSELIEVKDSYGVYAELASNGTVVDKSPLAYLVNVNSNDIDGDSRITNSKLLSATDANYINVDSSSAAVLRGAHYAKLVKSSGLRIENSLHVQASESGDSVVDRSNRAKLIKSPGSKHTTSEGSQSIRSPHSEFNNADAGIIRGSENGTVTDSYSARVTDSPNGKIYDAEEGKLVNSPATQLKVGRFTTVRNVVGKLIVDRPYEKIGADDAASLPDAKPTKGANRPGKTITATSVL